jgi:hypothetical protein
MKRNIVLVMLMPIVACSSFDSPEVTSCEEKLIGTLKSPSSYKRIESSVWDSETTIANLAGLYFGEDVPLHVDQLLSELNGHEVAVRHVGIKYDADNSFGASLRDSYYCNFVAVDGKLYSRTQEYDRKWSQHIDDLVDEKPMRTVKNTHYREPPDFTDPDYDPFPSSGIELPPY